ncbi:MAG: 5-formyltetrahydrofolate cyclo-ligase [Steroidobacteraceae bacterium]|nr:5-formyltetrahydrofolate cyclo-ligase [Steroidobacteraceae bacterium]
MNRSAHRSELRAALRERRRALDAAARTRLSRAIVRQLLRALGPAARGARIAGYAALPEEPDITPALDALLRRGAQIYLPRITSYRRHTMVFAAAGGALRGNRHGIPEPASGSVVLRAQALDIVLAPLVGFDRHGTRLGMGGGYYDRAFAFRRRRHTPARPRLIGIAFACQQVDALPGAAHDVRLDAVITEHGLTRFRRSTR